MSSEERHHLRHLRDQHIRAQGGLCYFCDVVMTDPDVPNPKPGTTATIEHLKPRGSGGGSNFLNTAASCLDCNNTRTKRKYAKGLDIPVVRLVSRRETTYAYTVPNDPDTLILCNLSLGRDAAMLELKRRERSPITLKHASDMTEATQ